MAIRPEQVPEHLTYCGAEVRATRRVYLDCQVLEPCDRASLVVDAQVISQRIRIERRDSGATFAMFRFVLKWSESQVTISRLAYSRLLEWDDVVDVAVRGSRIASIWVWRGLVPGLW